MKKRILGLLLVICLVAGMLPTVAYAEGGTSHEGWTELTKEILESTYMVESLGTYKYVLPSGHYYLGGDILVDKPIRFGTSSTSANVVLDLNGYELSKDDDTALLVLQYDSTLTIMDSSENKTGKIVSDYAICFNRRSKLNANGGTIEGDVYLFGDNVAIDNTDHSNVTVFRNGQIGGTYSTAIINGGIFYSTVNKSGYITGGTFYGEVTNNGTITGGTFYGTITGSGTVSDVTYRRIVTFDSNGGGEVPSQDILKDSTATEPTAPTKAGYSFEGWYNGDTEFDFANTPVTENIILKAKWTEKSSITFDATPQSCTYDGTAQAFSITGTTVTGFNISYKQNGQAVINPINADSYDIIITRAEDSTYKAVNETISNGLVINPKAVTATISAISDKTYTGNNIEPAITVYDGDTVIPASEYTVSYSNNKNIGTATVTLADKPDGNYTVIGTTTFEILPKSIDNAVITRSNTLTYDGTKQTQNISVTLEGFDAVTFDVSGNQQTDMNTNGDYTLTVTGNGNFTGTKNFNWNIAPATPTENPAKKTTARVIKGKALSDATITNGEILAIDGVTVLDGTFAWVDSTKAMSADGTEQMVFTPDNTNYAPITIDIAVSTYTTGGGSGSSGGGSGSYTPSYTIKFETNGGSSVKNQTVVKNNKVSSPVNPTKEGYVFDGWYTDKGLTKKYDFDTKVTGSLTLYAKWVEETWKNPFTDVNENDWFYEDVAYVYEHGMMAGTSKTTFSPNATTTRGMVVTVLYRLEGSPVLSSSSSFSDVASGAYYQDAVAWAVANGITSGYGNGKFGPNDPITREQFAAFLYRYAKYKGLNVSVGEDTNILSYNDALTISEYAFPAMQWLCGEGIMQGSNGNLMPAGNATRAQIAALLHRFCENVLNS